MIFYLNVSFVDVLTTTGEVMLDCNIDSCPSINMDRISISFYYDNPGLVVENEKLKLDGDAMNIKAQETSLANPMWKCQGGVLFLIETLLLLLFLSFNDRLRISLQVKFVDSSMTAPTNTFRKKHIKKEKSSSFRNSSIFK